MSRKISITLLLVLLVSLVLARPALAVKSYRAERFDVLIDLQGDGSAVITETVEFIFEGDPFTFAFREVSAAETDGITFIEASMDSATMSQGTRPGEVEVEPGDPLKVTWHFAPASNQAHVFTLRYRVEGVIRTGQGDTFIWRAIPEDHDYPILHSTITLIYPPEATAPGQPALDWDFDSTWEADRLILTARNIPEDEDLVLRATFAAGSLTQTTPQWQVRQEQARASTERALPVGLAAAIATLLLGGLGLLTYIRANGRDLSVSPVIPTSMPPGDVPPALIGKLTRSPHSAMGAIFDLAQRGVLEVREQPGFLGGRNHMLVWKDRTAVLQPQEQGLLDALFGDGRSEIPMSEIGTRLASGHHLFDKPLEQEAIRRGWLDPERKWRRTSLSVTGVLAMIASLTGLIASLVLIGITVERGGSWLFVLAAAVGASASLVVLSLALLIYAGTYSPLTPSGEEQAARWKGFAEYLRGVSRGSEPAIRPHTFERYLAYAAVFGLGSKWAKYFESLGGVPLPVWFHAAAGSQGSFASMVAVMSTSDSAGAGAGGGAGASGGGSSGAG
jgi:hypothetical protein